MLLVSVDSDAVHCTVADINDGFIVNFLSLTDIISADTDTPLFFERFIVFVNDFMFTVKDAILAINIVFRSSTVTWWLSCNCYFKEMFIFKLEYFTVTT